MLTRLCQLKCFGLIMLFAASGCSFFDASEPRRSFMTSFEAKWFTKNSEHSLLDQQGKVQPHNFFDVGPALSSINNTVNAIILTPEGSDHAYQLDLASGQRYYSHSYCSQDDVWKRYSGAISTPTFSIGIIPRLMDQLGDPQKVIIFGGGKVFRQQGEYHENRIRLIGAFVEQSCLDGNCLGKSNWISRLVFIGVDYQDKKFSSVSNLDELKEKIDWAQQKAVYENIDGRNGGAAASYPATRIGNLIPLQEAMDYYKKRSIFLSDGEASKIRSGCQSLYDKLWQEVGQEQPEDKAAKTVAELNAKLKLKNELKKKRRPIGFAARMQAFIKNYSSEYNTCQKFIYSGNINKNPEKFWFLSYLNIFMRLHNEGYYFDCKVKTWGQNVLNSEGKPTHILKDDVENCSDRDFDRAMDYLPNFLTGLKSSNSTYYRFVDYDTQTTGTHQKIYSWVKVRSKKFDCRTDPNVGVKKNMKVFPEDITWRPRDVKDIADELKIIY